MKRNARISFVALLALAAGMAVAPRAIGAPLSQARIILEINASAGDGGIQIFLDGEGWNRLEITDPNGQRIVDVAGSGSVGMTGMTELFFESAEPSFQDLPLDQLLQRFPAGAYRFEATSVDGKNQSGRATLDHAIPAGPHIVSPAEGSSQSAAFPLVVDWDPVTSAYPGTFGAVNVVGYEVIVERVKPLPLLVLDVKLPATATQLTIPVEFLQANSQYKFEVLAIDRSLNQTITESSFSTQ